MFFQESGRKSASNCVWGMGAVMFSWVVGLMSVAAWPLQVLDWPGV